MTVARPHRSSSTRPQPGLPATSYGYRPPRAATAWGWRCPAESCGQSECEPPRYWPWRCGCGRWADPQLDEPWAHEADGVRLPHLLETATDPDAEADLRVEWQAWRHRDALRRGAHRMADRLRAEGRALLDGPAGRAPAGSAVVRDPAALDAALLFPVVHDALDHDRLDAAAAELQFWDDRAVTHGVERNVRRRTNCLLLVQSQLDFLDHPGSEGHPGADQVEEAGVRLRAAVASVLTADLVALAARHRPARAWRSVS